MTVLKLAGFLGASGVLVFALGVSLGLSRLLSMVERDAIAAGLTNSR
jgi:hypothetical protein